MTMIYALEHLRKWAVSPEMDPPIGLGIFGDPIEHSLSPQIQNAALRSCEIAVQYAAFRIQPNDLAEALSLVRQSGFVGLNLTVPHKIAAVALMDSCDATARKVGAINTVCIRDGKLIGFNTDAPAFSRAVRKVFSVDLRDLRVLLLGAGGAGRAIAWQCANENSERLVVANRDVSKAEALVEELRPHFSGPRVLGPVARVQAIPLSDESLRHQIPHTDLIINATSVGLAAGDRSPIAANLLAPHLFVFDIVYRDGKTPLVRAAEIAGARACDGRTMLVEQGVAAFELWFNRPAPEQAMHAAIAS
jgi:shikimate dehydrogenase